MLDLGFGEVVDLIFFVCEWEKENNLFSCEVDKDFLRVYYMVFKIFIVFIMVGNYNFRDRDEVVVG